MKTDNFAIPEILQKDIHRAVGILKDGGCSEIFLFGSGVTGKIRDGSNDSTNRKKEQYHHGRIGTKNG